MASTVLVKDALWRVSVLLQDAAPQFNRHAERTLVDYLNDAQVALAKFLPPACSRVDAIKLKPGTLQSIETIAQADVKPGDGSTATGPIHGNSLLSLLYNMGPAGVTPGRAIRLLEADMLTLPSPNWAAESAKVVSGYVYDPQTPRHFRVTPGVPATPAVWVMAAYCAQPSKIAAGGAAGAEVYLKGGSSTATLGVADEYLDDLVNYAVARANMENTEWADGNKAAAFTAMFVQSVNAKAQVLGGSSPNLKLLPFAPAPLARAA